MALPHGDRRSAIYVSGAGARHLRLGYLIQRRFPGLLKAWWLCPPAPSQPQGKPLSRAWHRLVSSQTAANAIELLREGDPRSFVAFFGRRLRQVDLRKIRRRVLRRSKIHDAARFEEEILSPEVRALKTTATLHPERVEHLDDDLRLAQLAELSPYFLLCFGAARPSGRFIDATRGPALEQRAGWAPAMEGDAATETALYHRELGWVGSTVHLLDDRAETDPIVRRSTATLHPDDDFARCLLAVDAVGNKLMIDAIEDVLNARELLLFTAPSVGGHRVEASRLHRDAIARDLETGWLANALEMEGSF
jgi:folate-dependent phosphoribosylglycinamide formyltransferase PurN